MRKLIFNGNIKQRDNWLTPGYICIDDGVIESIHSGLPDENQFSRADELLDADGMAVIPGLVNGHTHFSQTFMRGLAGGRPLIQWLKELIWPLQSAISVEEMELAALLGLAENLRGGVTEVVDHHKIVQTRDHTLAVKKVAEKVGLRCTIARSWSNTGKNPQDDGLILDELQTLFETNSREGKVKFASGPISTWRCSEELLQKTHELALKYNSFTHVHVSESVDEVNMSLDQTGLRPVTWLEKIGVLDQNSQIVHAVCVEEDEIQSLAQSGAKVIHCPVSNAVLGSGIAPIRKMLDQGVKIRLGTDGPASNDTQDCFENMKMSICLARASNLDSANLTTMEALKMAMDNHELKAGMPADIVIVQCNNLHTIPIHDLDSALTLNTKGDDVDTVLVDGIVLMRHRKLKSIDEDILIKECNHVIKSLRKRAGITL
jgi:5-methylthioadenosine/S-adenosylhomocysteine deaminase